ncbi:MAG: hypothetical protein IJK64_08455 [Clostridia bacterium]|nr:hypothetical protein [Clostridia bacterium]
MPAGGKSAKQRRPRPLIPRAALAGGLCAVCYFGLLALYAFFSDRLELSPALDLPVGLGLAAVCACAAGFLCAARGKERFLISGAVCGTASLLPVCLVLALLGGAGIGLPLLAGILLVSASAGGLAASHGGRRVKL